MTFKPDFGAGEESAEAMPWFRDGSAHCLLERATPGKPVLLAKLFAVLKPAPRTAQLQIRHHRQGRG